MHPRHDRTDVLQRPARRGRSDDGYLYLGEIAERKLRIGDVSLTSYELNPTAAATTAATFEVAPEDVVLLPADDGAQ